MADESAEDNGIRRGNRLMAGTSLVLSTAALIVSLIAAVALPGPTGLRGPEGQQGPQGEKGGVGAQGSQGPAGPGTVMAVNVSTGVTPIETTCTHYAGAEVTITAPSAGVVVVSSVVQLYINHEYGMIDTWYVVNGLDAGGCGSMSQAAIGHEPAYAEADPQLRVSLFVQSTFSVTAGTFTFYVNGYMINGQDSNDRFWFSNSVAVFYPS